jgi:hypothetical protein
MTEIVWKALADGATPAVADGQRLGTLVRETKGSYVYSYMEEICGRWIESEGRVRKDRAFLTNG